MIKILSSSESSFNLLTLNKKKVKKSDKKVLWCRDDTDTSLATIEQEIKYDWGDCHWLQKKWNQNQDEHQNTMTAILELHFLFSTTLNVYTNH